MLHLMLFQGVCRYLTCMTASNWSKKARGSSKAGATSEDTSGSTGSDSDAAAVLRQWLLGSRGKGLVELVEALGGKPVSLKASSLFRDTASILARQCMEFCGGDLCNGQFMMVRQLNCAQCAFAGAGRQRVAGCPWQLDP